MKKTIFLFAIFAFVFCLKIDAQQNTSLSNSQKQQLQKVWYESPKESKGDTLVFRKTKYVLDYTVDDPAFAFSLINFTDALNYKIEYWRWCKLSPHAYEGTYQITNDQVNLNFGQGKCQNQLKVLSLDNELLKVLITEN